MPPHWRTIKVKSTKIVSVSREVISIVTRNYTQAELIENINLYLIENKHDIEHNYQLNLTDELSARLVDEVINLLDGGEYISIAPKVDLLVNDLYAIFNDQRTIDEEVTSIVNEDVLEPVLSFKEHGKFLFFKSVLTPFKDLLNDFQIYRLLVSGRINLSGEAAIIVHHIKFLTGIRSGIYILIGNSEGSFLVSVPIKGQSKKALILNFLNKVTPLGHSYTLEFYGSADNENEYELNDN